MIGLCMGLAGSIWAQLPVANFTLAWNHSIEKIRWEEDYRVTAQGLVLEQARVRGNGAGMQLGRTPQAGDYQLCMDGNCEFISRWVGPANISQPFLQLWGCEMTKLSPTDEPLPGTR